MHQGKVLIAVWDKQYIFRSELHVLKTKGDVANFGRDKRICHVAFDPQAARVSRVHASIEWTDEVLPDRKRGYSRGLDF